MTTYADQFIPPPVVERRQREMDRAASALIGVGKFKGMSHDERVNAALEILLQLRREAQP